MFRSVIPTLLILIFCSNDVFGQDQRSNTEAEIISVIETLFNGMRNSDSAAVASVFRDDAILRTTMNAENGDTRLSPVDLNSFLQAIGRDKEEIWDERILDYEVMIDGHLASVFTPYEFYRGDKFSHCGANSFQMVRMNSGWKVYFLIDTRRTAGCSG